MSTSIGKRSFEAIGRYMLREFSATYNFLSMSCTLRDMGLNNCADWCLQKSEESRLRAMEIYSYLVGRGLKFKMAAVPVSRQDWRAPLHVFEEINRQALEISGLITIIYEASIADKDYATQQFVATLFDKHQRSEQEAGALLNKLRIMQTSEIGVFQFDSEMRERLISD